VTVIREALAALHEREEEYTRAAQILAGIDLDSGARIEGQELGHGRRTGFGKGHDQGHDHDVDCLAGIDLDFDA